ncbi:hypothetical protein Y695_00787 [Hydrogenophaga sp. T4]|nr:hypothetical protein Y695_00787 [Hydrogenophaga sp. T4]
MQCSECKEIVPYAHDSIAHVCGSAKLGKSAEPTEASIVKEPSSTIDIDDLISKIERLASLKENGALTIEEFEIQKKRLLG